MKRFEFRLETVLKVRQAQEESARDRYLDKRAERLEAESVRIEIDKRRIGLLRMPLMGIRDHQALNASLDSLDQRESEQRHVIRVLEEEEESLREAWNLSMQEVEVVEKLKEAEWEAWRAEEARQEQLELDEWSVLRTSRRKGSAA
jgi:flagellar export protein FliJ